MQRTKLMVCLIMSHGICMVFPCLNIFLLGDDSCWGVRLLTIKSPEIAFFFIRSLYSYLQAILITSYLLLYRLGCLSPIARLFFVNASRLWNSLPVDLRKKLSKKPISKSSYVIILKARLGQTNNLFILYLFFFSCNVFCKKINKYWAYYYIRTAKRLVNGSIPDHINVQN